MTEFGSEYDYPKLKGPSSKPVLQADPSTVGVIQTFLELLDTFNDYTGHAGKFLVVSGDETRIEVTALAFDSDKHFAHVQVAASVDWGTINHALAKFPAVQIFNDIGEVARANIAHVDNNNVTITSDVAFSGVAYFN